MWVSTIRDLILLNSLRNCVLSRIDMQIYRLSAVFFFFFAFYLNNQSMVVEKANWNKF